MNNVGLYEYNIIFPNSITFNKYKLSSHNIGTFVITDNTL